MKAIGEAAKSLSLKKIEGFWILTVQEGFCNAPG